jgi:hypothetical protein
MEWPQAAQRRAPFCGTLEGGGHRMAGVGCGFSVLAVMFGVLATLPLLGWLNWITTLPLALLAIIFSAFALTGGRRSTIAGIGLAGGILSLCWAAFRLSLGGGLL